MSQSAPIILGVLSKSLRSHLTPTALVWFNSAHAEACASGLSTFLLAYTGASQAGGDRLLLTTDDRSALGAAVPGLDFDTWTNVDAARALLLMQRAASLGDAACAEAATACYELGDAAEQQSWLRAISLLPDPAQFTPLAIDACRTNILPVFQAVACGNPFPAEHLPERNFNQMVLKALFNAVPLANIYRLADRKNSELARMAGDYADERRAAGRTVPADIGLAL